MKTVYYVTVFLLFTLIVFLGYLVVWCLAAPFDRNRVVSHHYSRFWSKGIYKLCPWWKVKVEGLENLKPGTPYIVLSNHQGLLDIPLLYVLPFNFKWVSKKEVYSMPVFGWVLRMHGDIAIERGGAASAKRMMNQCTEQLRRGVSIVMFPEGTRTKTGRVQPFMPGAFLLAKKAKVELLPVVIDGVYDALGTKGKLSVTTPHTFQVRILPPMPVEEVMTLKFNEISDKLHLVISEEHKKMAPWRYDGVISDERGEC